MANSIKERITADLQKARTESGLRAGRIREIVQAAVSQAVVELKGGSSEIRDIAQDAIAAVMENLKDNGNNNTKEELAASVEGVIAGISSPTEEKLAETQLQMDQLQAEIEAQQQSLETDVDAALVGIETAGQQSSTNFRSLIEAALITIKEKYLTQLRQQYLKLKEQLIQLDGRLSEQYGDRYTQIKQNLEQNLEQGRAWYDEAAAKAKAEGVTPVEQKQADLKTQIGEAGTAAAKAEQTIKQQLKNLIDSKMGNR